MTGKKENQNNSEIKEMKINTGIALINLTFIESLPKRIHPITQNPVTLISPGKGVGHTVDPKFQGIVSQTEAAMHDAHTKVDD